MEEIVTVMIIHAITLYIFRNYLLENSNSKCNVKKLTKTTPY